MLYSRRLRGSRATLTAVVAGVLLAGCGGSGHSASRQAASPASKAASRMLARVIAATQAAGSVHLTISAKAGPYSAEYSSDASTTAGRQVITANNGGQATVLEVNGVGYFRANATAFAGFLGVPASIAKQDANKWISFHASDKGYSRVISGVTLGAIAEELALSGQVTSLAARKIGGRAVSGLSGGVPVVWGAASGIMATLYFAAAGKPLPVTFDGGVSGGQGEHMTFSRWGEPVHVTAPASSIASSSVLPG